MSDFYSGKRVLVTGGTGMIGIPLVHKLVELGAEVRVVSLDPFERAEGVLPKAAKYYRYDLTNASYCEAMTQRQDFVFHVAGIKGSVALGKSKAASWFTPIVQFNTNMLDAAHKAGVKRYLYTSSIGVYPEGNLFVEEDSTAANWNGNPFSADMYPGWAKRIGEIQVGAYKEEFGWEDISIVRPANVYGPHDNFDPETAMVVGSLISKFTNKKPDEKVNVWGDGSPVRDFIFSEDVAEGMLLAMEHGTKCQPVNLGSGEGYSIKELALTIAKEFGFSEDDLEFDTSKPSGESVRVMDTSRAKGMIKFEAKTTLAEGVRKTADWYKKTDKTKRYDALK